VVVTLMESTPLPRPKRIGDRVVLEPGSPVVWFTFEGAWHDIGAFHLADGSFTGWYANVLTPVDQHPPSLDRWRWSTTDLCLDVWCGPDGPMLLDEEELASALASGAVEADIGRRAREEAERLLGEARNDEWPPALVREWPLERARRVVLGDVD
jgi:predicted RNA-binding protein associated with RNAse of E/G family